MKKRLLLVAIGTLFLLPVPAPGAEDLAPREGEEQVELTTEVAAEISPAVVWGEVEPNLWGGRTGYLHPFVSVAERYTDNVFSSPTDQESEWMTLISPGLWLVVPESREPLSRVKTTIAAPGGLEIGRFRTSAVRRFQGFALYQADIERHARFDEEDRVNHRGEGFLQYQSPRGVSLALLDVYEQEQDPYFAGSGRTLQVDTFTANLFQVQAGVPLGAKLRFRADYGNYVLDFDSDANAFRARTDNTVAAALAYRAFPKTDLLLRYEYVDIGYDRDVLPDSTEHHAFIGSEWNLTAKTRGRVLLGYGQKEFRGSGIEDRQDLIGEARLDYAVTQKTATYLQFTRKTNEPDSPVGGGILAQRLQLGGRLRLLAKLSAVADLYYQRDDYEEPIVFAGKTGIRQDTYYSAGLNLGYTPWRGFGVDLGYRYLERDSNFETLRYQSNIAYLRLSATL